MCKCKANDFSNLFHKTCMQDIIMPIYAMLEIFYLHYSGTVQQFKTVVLNIDIETHHVKSIFSFVIIQSNVLSFSKYLCCFGYSKWA